MTAATKKRGHGPGTRNGKTEKIRKILRQCHGLPICTQEIAALIGTKAQNVNALMSLLKKRGEVTSFTRKGVDELGRPRIQAMWRLAK